MNGKKPGDTMSTQSARRSMFLVTGANAELLKAAMASAADVICLDFEDTVSDKCAAHKLAETLLSGETAAEVAIRINPLTTEEGLSDLLRLRKMPRRPPLVKLTKVSDPFEVKLAAEMLPDVKFIVIIETAQAVERAPEIACASPAVAALTLGGKDLSNALGCRRSWGGLLHARGRLVQAAAMAGVQAIDEPHRPLDDLGGLATTCARSAEMGFTGKITVDLRHIPTINALF